MNDDQRKVMSIVRKAFLNNESIVVLTDLSNENSTMNYMDGTPAKIVSMLLTATVQTAIKSSGLSNVVSITDVDGNKIAEQVIATIKKEIVGVAMNKFGVAVNMLDSVNGDQHD